MCTAMMTFIETISLRDGAMENLPYHDCRIYCTMMHFYGRKPDFSPADTDIPMAFRQGHCKLRLVYGERLLSAQFSAYAPRQIETIRCVEGNYLHYAYKFEDRTPLLSLYAMKGDADEILIVKNGQITDTSYSNVVLSKGDRFYTPLYPLLPGTRRQALLKAGVIEAIPIKPDDLPGFDRLYLINAMIGLDDNVSVPVEAIQLT